MENVLKEPFVEDIPAGSPVLLHCCCAPCSGAILEWILCNDIHPIVYYSNSNIFPLEEYRIRLEECRRYCEMKGVEIVESEYGHEEWLKAVKGLEACPERGSRCLECFKFRLLDAAGYALSRSIPYLATTLASSRWKSLEQVDQAGIWAVQTAQKEIQQPSREELDEGCRQTDISNGTPLLWWKRNWRKGGLQERRNAIIKEMNFYNQNWCGCEFSKR